MTCYASVSFLILAQVQCCGTQFVLIAKKMNTLGLLIHLNNFVYKV